MSERLTQPLVRIDGELVGSVSVDLHSLRICETSEGLRTLELEVQVPAELTPDGVEPNYLDIGTFDFGKRIEVVIDSLEDPRVVFEGKISAIELELEDSLDPHVRVFAEDPLMELRLTRRVQSWAGLSDAEIAREIAGRHGLQAVVDAEGPSWAVIEQWNMSDLAFLRERGRLIQAEVWVERDTLHFESRAARRGAELTLVHGNELIEVVVRADLAHQRSGVRVRGWDAAQALPIDVLAGGSLIRDEVGQAGRTGPELLEQNFGKRGSVRVREVPHDRDQAQAMAEAELRRRARAFVRISGVTRGSPTMQVGSRLTLERIGWPFAGPGYYVTEICHTYDHERGFRSAFEAERATLNRGADA